MILDEFGKPLPTLPAVREPSAEKAVSSVPWMGQGWYPLVREPFPGAWQRNISIDRNTVLAFHATFAAMTLIASDIAKLRVKLIKLNTSSGIWDETINPAYDPVLRKPNAYQTRIQYWESYFLSKLSNGNTFVLKERDERGVVYRFHVLDPRRVRPMISESGEVFYEVNEDTLAGIETQVMIPAREIVHDRFNCLFHPLVGLSPIFANGLAATQGVTIQNSSAWLFENRAMVGGILTAPGTIGDEEATRLREQWQENFSGKNVGKIAVLGGGLKFEKSPVINPVDAQMIEQLKWTSEVVCSVFHMPGYKIGVGQAPSYNNIQALNLEYYQQCLQAHIEAAEVCLDEGLGLASDVGVEFDIDGLLRMDTLTQIQAAAQGIGAGLVSPNEGRKKLNLGPVTGGESPYLQQQNYSLAALAKRDALDDPFNRAAPAPAPPAASEETDPGDDGGDGQDDGEQRSITYEDFQQAIQTGVDIASGDAF